MTSRTYQICSRCVMDTTDPEIVFDSRGVCNHCHRYDQLTKKNLFPGEEGQRRLKNIVEKIKKDGADKEYDCIVGVSGGVDSTFCAYKAKDLGLRPLAVHLDNGWDSELAVKNIENILTKLDIDLYTHVIEWEEFKDLQLAFLKASTPDSEIPTDHAILALLDQIAERYEVKNIIVGFNIKTESHLPRAWSTGYYDWRYVKGIHKQFGTKPLKTFPHLTLRQYLMYKIKHNFVPLLNYLDYNKNDAMEILIKDLDWRYYGGKHYESIYTRFYQGYILPRKFGFDKRKTHFSSLICSGEMTRAEALEKLQEETYPRKLQEEDKEYVVNKFDISMGEFEGIMNLPKKTYNDYPNYQNLLPSFIYNMAHKMFKFIQYKLYETSFNSG